MLEKLIPKTEVNRAALRTAIGVVAAVLIAFALHLDKPYWAGMTVVMLSNLYTGSVLDKAIMRLLGTIIGAWLGYFLAKFVANSFFLYFTFNFLIVAIAVYYYNFSKYAYAYLMAALAAFMVISELGSDPSQAFFVAIWRPIEIGLGVIVSALSVYCLFPNALGDNIVKEVHGIFAAMDAILAKISEYLHHINQDDLSQLSKDNLQLKRKIYKAADLIDFMRHERRYSKGEIDHFRFLLDSLFSLTRQINYFVTANKFQAKPLNNMLLIIDNLLNVIRQDFSAIKLAFFAKGSDVILNTPAVLTEFEIHLKQLSLQNDQDSLVIAHFLRQINRVLMDLRMVLIAGKGPQPRNKRITHQQQLRNDPDIIIHGIKAGLTATLALAFWLITNWPGGLNGIVSSIILSIRRNLFEMKNTGVHRLLGCLLGGGVFIFFLNFSFFNLYLFVIVIFFSVWAFSYFSFKYVPYAYIGLQANIALIIAMAQKGGPPIDIAPPFERLGGIIIGITASFIVANLLWRTDLLTMFLRQMSKLRHRLINNCTALLNHDRSTRRLYDLTNLFWLCRGVMESLENERLSQRKEKIFLQAKKERENLVFIQATINNVEQSIDQELAKKTADKFMVNLAQLEKDVADLYQKKNKDRPFFVKEKLEQALSLLVFRMSNAKIALEEVENCVAYLHSLLQLVKVKMDNLI